MNRKNDALGVFDSGVGGLTVVKALQDLLPHENICYLADTLNLPYGNKSPKDLEHFSFLNSQFLLKQSVKALVIACNTASACAYETLKLRFNIPLFDVISPVVHEAIRTSKNQKFAVLATESTIHSNAYEKLLKSFNKEATVISIACPLLVPLVEENLLERKIATQLVKQYLDPIQRADIDTLILGCTHYPLLKNLIQKELNPRIQILDSALLCAQNVAHFLEENQLKNIGASQGECHFYVSDRPQSFQAKGSQFLGQSISQVKKVDPKEEVR